MFVIRRWLQAHLAKLGVTLVVIGFLLTVLGIASEVHGFNSLTRDPDSGWRGIVMYLYAIGKISWSFGETLIWAGVLLYCFGRFTESSFVTIVGFESSKPSQFVVRGPDENNVVWIGRHYSTTSDAEAVATTLKQRFDDADKTPI